MRGSADSPQPVSGQMVVLHRISADSSGPVDSVRTSDNGAYRFRYRLDSPRSMYIISARYSGVAYFTTPLREAAVTSPDADVSVYDTTSAAFPLSVRARHVVIAPPEAGGVRRVVDVYEVANDSNRTLVAGAVSPTWSVTLPEGAREPGSGGGDLPPEAFRFTQGRAELLVPFPPGSRQLVLTYAIPAARATIPVADASTRLEVLLEGADAKVTGAGLLAEEPVSMEGRSFQRYIASPVPAGTSFMVARSGWSESAKRGVLLAVAALAVALGIVVGRRAPAPAAVPVESRPAADVLAREIVALDRVYSAADRREGPAGEHYRARREALMGQLVELQAVEDREPVR